MILEDAIPAPVRPLIAWNPLTRIVRAYRERLLSPVWPHWQDLAILTACSAGIFILGGLFFRHLKRGFADVL
jgi:lipopolysaccharide transport system permease protein